MKHVVRIGMILGLLCWMSPALGQVDPECDADGDGRVDGYDAATWDDDQQQANMLNYFGAVMVYSPLRSPAGLEAFRLAPQLEFDYLPALTCLERAVFEGQKTEHTNKSPVFPRLRARYGLPFGAFIGVNLLPPVPVAGIRSGIIGGEIGIGRVVKEKLELGLRAQVVGGRIEGDLAGPFEGQEAEDDVYRSTVYGAELGAGYRVATSGLRLTPYVGAGFTRIIALMYVGESLPDDYDETDPNQATVPTAGNDAIAEALYAGPHFQLGIAGQRDQLEFTLETVIVPLGFRLLVTPRLAVGYRFF